jgi:hypothetical protein
MADSISITGDKCSNYGEEVLIVARKIIVSINTASSSIHSKGALDFYTTATGAVDFSGTHTSNVLTAESDSIRIFSNNIIEPAEGLDFICENPYSTNPADTTLVDGYITITNVYNQAGTVDSICVKIQNLSTASKIPNYDITSTRAWISPTFESTSSLTPFDFDSPYVNYIIPGSATGRDKDTVRAILTIAPDFADTTYSTIYCTGGAGVPCSLAIITYSLKAGQVGVFYSDTLEAECGVPPYRWSISNSLPSGLSLDSSTGEISGTPTSAGTDTFTVMVTDSHSPPDTTINELSITILPGSLFCIEVSPDSVTLEPGQSQQFTAAGSDSFGNSVYFQPLWSATGGTIEAHSSTATYTAGDVPGDYTVTAEDAETQLQGQAEVRIILPGDFNSDGRVWTEDFVMFVTQFGRQQGDEGFDPIYDLDGDGRVWTEDFAIFVAQFGKTSGAAKRVAGLPSVGKNQNAEISVSVQTKVTSLSSETREFTVELSVKNATELRGYGLILDYEPEALEFLGATPGKNNLLNKAGGSTPLFLVVSNPDRPGQVWIANALADSKPAQGNGLLVSFSFRTRGRLSGSSLPIGLSGVELFDAQLRLNSVSAENLTKQIRLVPGQNRLAQNYPNPFNAVTCINYQLAQPAFTTIKVYNLSGQLVRTLVKEKKPAGWYSVRWDGRDSSGRTVASGIYFYHISAGEFSKVHKLLLLK